MALADADKMKIKSLFSDFLEIADQRKQLNDRVKEIINEAALVLEKKPKETKAFFNLQKKKAESGVDELEELLHISEMLES